VRENFALEKIMTPLRSLALTFGFSLAAAAAVALAGDDPAKAKVTFGDVKPIFSKYACTDCHNPEKMKKSKYDMTTYDATMKDVKAGDADASKLVKMIANKKMPPKKAGKVVAQDELDVIRAWITGGAPEK
jgi:hypothetical protein